jgi:hypothetical protein
LIDPSIASIVFAGIAMKNGLSVVQFANRLGRVTGAT